VIVNGSIASLKVAFTVVLMGTFELALMGFAEIIVGFVVSRVAAVVKVHGFGTIPAPSGLPARSVAPAVTVAVYSALGRRLAVGVKVAVLAIAA
jgi:hypothetical protein